MNKSRHGPILGNVTLLEPGERRMYYVAQSFWRLSAPTELNILSLIRAKNCSSPEFALSSLDSPVV